MMNPSTTPGALCRDYDPELWFPDTATAWYTSPSMAKVQEICLSCPLMAGCREFGQRTRQFGVWGGTYLENGKGITRRSANVA